METEVGYYRRRADKPTPKDDREEITMALIFGTDLAIDLDLDRVKLSIRGFATGWVRRSSRNIQSMTGASLIFSSFIRYFQFGSLATLGDRDWIGIDTCR